MGASARVGGAEGGVLGTQVHRVGTSEQLLGTPAPGLRGALVASRVRGVEVGLLVVQQCLVFVARTLCVIEHRLGRGASGLRECSVDLTGVLLGIFPACTRFTVQLGLFLVKTALVAVADRLLAVSEGLFEPGDALVGVEVLLRSVCHQVTSVRVRGRSCSAGTGRVKR